MQNSKLPGKPEEYLGWVLEDGDASVEEFSDLLISSSFWRRWLGKENVLDSEDAVQRAVAEAKYNALDRAFTVESLPERASTHLLLDAKRTGWANRLPDEYQQTSDLLASLEKEMGDTNESSRRDLLFAVDVLLPALARAGVDVNKLLNLRKRWSKLRVAIPHLRVALSKPSDEVPELLNNIIDAVSDEGITVRALREHLRQNGHSDHPEITSEVYQIGPDQFVYVAVVNNEQLNFLAKIIRFHIVDVLKPFSKFAEFLRRIS